MLEKTKRLSHGWRLITSNLQDKQDQFVLASELCISILPSIKVVIEVTWLSQVKAEGRGTCLNLSAPEGQPISLPRCGDPLHWFRESPCIVCVFLFLLFSQTVVFKFIQKFSITG